MNAKMWEEFWNRISKTDGSRMGSIKTTALYDIKDDIERRHLPERVAEILEKGSTKAMIDNSDIKLGVSITRYWREGVAKALRTGDLSEIEKWTRKEE